MSYNAELQSNNADLKAILDTVNALGDSNSNSGSVETYLGTFYSTNTSYGTADVYYMNSSGSIANTTAGAVKQVTAQVAKGTLLTTYGLGPASITTSGSISLVYGNAATECCVWYVEGGFQLTLNFEPSGPT